MSALRRRFHIPPNGTCAAGDQRCFLSGSHTLSRTAVRSVWVIAFPAQCFFFFYFFFHKGTSVGVMHSVMLQKLRGHRKKETVLTFTIQHLLHIFLLVLPVFLLSPPLSVLRHWLVVWCSSRSSDPLPILIWTYNRKPKGNKWQTAAWHVLWMDYLQ